MKKIIASFFGLMMALVSFAQTADPVPSARQNEWSKMEFYLFIHFGPNTFTDLEWGKGTEQEEVFNPTALDCRQWCRIAKAAGAKGIIITAKHHDGFCLWPSAYSKHTVAQSKWKNGKGDVLKELSEACRLYGLKMGVYLSPWDRNHPSYGTPEYNDIYVNMMKEVVSKYGPFFEFWWDGANGEGPNGKKQVYDWNKFEKTMRTIAPNTPVFSDIGPDIRWVGNENGFAGKTNWNSLDTAGFTRGAGAPSTDTLNAGNIYGKSWIPAECDVSIRKGWFYHAEEDKTVKTPEQLFQLYLKSVGRGAALLLNVPPDRRGLINAKDSAALVGFKRLRDDNFDKNLARHSTVKIDNKELGNLNDGNENSYTAVTAILNPVTVRLPAVQGINCVVLKEYLQKGQHCQSFKLFVLNSQREIVQEIDGTTIGRKRVITFDETEAAAVQLVIGEQKAPTNLAEIEVYKIDDSLVEK
jgi:alpha-L-fucosidase